MKSSTKKSNLNIDKLEVVEHENKRFATDTECQKTGFLLLVSQVSLSPIHEMRHKKDDNSREYGFSGPLGRG